MAGPWERFSAPSTPANAGPWSRFAPPADDTPSTPPPGAISHGATGSYIAAQPEISVARVPGASERDNAVAMEALKKRGENNSAVDTAMRAVMPFTQGTTLGAGDEITSALAGVVNAAKGGSAREGYDIAQEYQRQELDRQRQEHPFASTAAEVAGGVGTGLAAARSGLTASNGVAQVTEPGWGRAVATLPASAAEGAAYGGLAGLFGADGSVSDRVDQAKRGLGLGAVVGAAAPVVAKVAEGVGGGVYDAYKGWANPSARGDELVVKGLIRDGMPPEQIAQALEAAQSAGQPEYRALDAAGRNTQRIGAMAAKTPGPFRDEVASTLGERQTGQHDRIAGYVNDALGPGDKALATEQALADSRRTAAQPLYDAAYARPAPSGPAYDDLTAKRSVQDAMSTVRRVAEENNQPLSDLFTTVPNPNPKTVQTPSSVLGPDGQPVMTSQVVDPTITVPTTRGWDLVKRALDKQVDAGFNSTDASQKYAAATVRETRDALRSQLSADNPDYAKALGQYADDSASLDALKTGRVLGRAPNADEAVAAYEGLQPGEKDLAKIGAAREMTAAMGENRSPGANRADYFARPGTQTKLDALIEDPQVRALLDQRLGREQQMVRANRAVTGGSNTAENLSDGADIGSQGGALAALFSGHPLRAAGLAAGTAIGSAQRAATGMNEHSAQRVGDFLMSADPNTIRGLADLFVEMRDAATRPSVVPSAVSAGFNAGRSGDRRGQ